MDLMFAIVPYSRRQQTYTLGLSTDAVGAYCDVSARDGEQKRRSRRDLSSLPALQEAAKVTTRSQAAIACFVRIIRNVNELHGGGGSPVHSCSQSKTTDA